MKQIDYYFSLLSGFAYMAGDRLEKIAAKHDVAINYKPYDIVTMFDALGAQKPADRPEGRKVYRTQELTRLSKKTGLPIKLDAQFWPTNAAPASYAIIAAVNAGGGDVAAVIASLNHAMWAEDKDIADDAVIAEALKAGGFDPMLSMTGMLQGAETYVRNTEEGLAAGVFGSPFYIVKDSDERFWGQNSLEDLELHLEGKI
ncbi:MULTISPECIES: 2-hydroxychromene-2-carboxylate isomerase [Pacificibacter]|uniref:2-hydroxychromene-2-carboxylate isomerase n=1 Tax=Pacificibacter TaxID=1042323 RepID=UPI001C085F5E|nr:MULTISPECIES: 2-hydroxychromene-2-carboxylate isomerase [Pacificibacter]MBU2934764.1 2-hydroxychromene-2-carboxylate isomerase [Pacificibacter marinus]MDO6615738.1 2-hydroxychromene-2-carboxylate isomerase [Pacificibacter sp. 1_MG-2023]